jgi:hypothetical protein
MKGRGNEKPAKHYHREIANLLKHPRIKGIMGGGYEHKNNFHLTDLSPELQKEVLKANPNLITMDGSEEDLHKILYGNVIFPEKHKNVLQTIASNPNLDPKYHERLVGDEDWRVRKVIASNPNLDPKHHERLVDDKDLDVRVAIASNPNLDPKYHERLVGDESDSVRSAIARNPNLDPKHHERLVGDQYVRAAIASNPNLDPKHHERLVGDKSWYVRKIIALNPNLDPKHHERLVGDEEHSVRMAIALNPNLDPKLHERLVGDEDLDVRKAIASNPNLDPKSHERLVDDEDWRVRKAIASNPNLDPKYFERLLEDSEPIVRQEIKNNPSYIKWKEEQEKSKNNINKSDLNKSDNFVRRGILLAALAGTAQHVHNELQGQKKEAGRPYASQEEVVVEKPKTESEKAFDEAQKQAFGIAAKGWPLSRKLAKETIKAHPDLHQQHGYLLHLSPSAFKEVINNNPEIKKDIALRHYDKLHEMFNGDKDKIFDAYKAKSMKTKEL